MRLDSEIPKRHPQKAAVEDAIRGVLRGRSGSWDVWIHVPAHKGVSWYVQIRCEGGFSCAILFESDAEQSPVAVEAQVRRALRVS